MLKKNSPMTRFGFVISNKIDKRATRRNALKRRLRAMARQSIDKVLIGFDIIVIVREQYPFPYDSSVMATDFQKGLEGLKVLK